VSQPVIKTSLKKCLFALVETIHNTTAAADILFCGVNIALLLQHNGACHQRDWVVSRDSPANLQRKIRAVYPCGNTSKRHPIVLFNRSRVRFDHQITRQQAFVEYHRVGARIEVVGESTWGTIGSEEQLVDTTIHYDSRMRHSGLCNTQHCV
jgi:hypothetical protein